MCVSRAAERVREEACERRNERLPPPEDRLPESRRLLMLMPRDPQRAGSTQGGGGPGLLPSPPSSQSRRDSFSRVHSQIKGVVALPAKSCCCRIKKKKRDEFAVSFSSGEDKSPPAGICQVRD